jgi:hypothetical protein
MEPEPLVVVQIKPLEYKPLYTQVENRPVPAVMHVCRESCNKYMYRENDAANNDAGTRHAFYARIFPDPDFKMIFFSFEADALHLMSFSKWQLLYVEHQID